MRTFSRREKVSYISNLPNPRCHKQFRQPVDEHAHLVTQMPVRGIDDMQWQGAVGPAGKDGDEVALGERVTNHEGRCLGDAEAGQCGVDIAAAVVDREDVTRADFQRFVAALEFETESSARSAHENS